MMPRIGRRGLLAGAATLCLRNPASAQSLQDVSMALSSSSLGAAGPRIAQEVGLFARHGIVPRFSIMTSSSDAIAALLSGSVSTALAGTPELIVAHARGQKQLVALATTYAGFSVSLVLARAVADKLGASPSAPIAERLKALDGLVIASPSPVTIGTVTLKSAAHAVGASIRWTYMAQPAMQSAFETGAIQGYLAAAPYWAFPVAKGQGVLWLSGPKRDLPPEFTPALSSQLQTTRDFARANPALMQALAAVFADLARAVEDRPADIKAAIQKLFPGLDAETTDLLFQTEAYGWKGQQATAAVMAREISLVQQSGTPLPSGASLDPASMLYP